MKTIQEICTELEKRAPASTAAEWDNVGLLAGSRRWKTSSAVISVDLDEEVVTLARRKRANLIVTHHPCIFPKSRGVARVVDSPLQRALENGIAVVAAHTNFDSCALEVPRRISHAMDATPRGRLADSAELLKLAVFVPTPALDAVRSALAQAGAGQIGDYDSCSFASKGEGTFRGGPHTRPSIGLAGRLERVEEFKLEVVLPRGLKQRVLEALRQAHPYEEVAYDLYPVEAALSARGLVPGLGFGFWAEFPGRGISSQEFRRRVQRAFGVRGGLWTPAASRQKTDQIRRFGFQAGKGSSAIAAAVDARCDVLLTGETGYHDALSAQRQGVSVFEIGHRQSEIFFARVMSDWMRQIGLKAVVWGHPKQTFWAAKP